MVEVKRLYTFVKIYPPVSFKQVNFIVSNFYFIKRDLGSGKANLSLKCKLLGDRLGLAHSHIPLEL